MSDAKEKNTEAEGGEHGEGAKPKSKKKLMFIGLGVLALIAGAGVPMFLMGGGEEAAEEAHVQEEPAEELKRLENLDLGIFIVNLSETSSFLKTHIVVEYDAALLEKQTAVLEGAGGGEGEAAGGGTPHYLTKKENVIRHTIIRILSSKTVDEVLTPDGKDLLTEELIDGLNDVIAVEQPVVSQIYFTEFIIQ